MFSRELPNVVLHNDRFIDAHVLLLSIGCHFAKAYREAKFVLPTIHREFAGMYLVAFFVKWPGYW